jgi:hypothetical protein
MQATRRHPNSAFGDEKTEYVVSLSVRRDSGQFTVGASDTNYSPEAFALTGVESNSSAIQC